MQAMAEAAQNSKVSLFATFYKRDCCVNCLQAAAEKYKDDAGVSISSEQLLAAFISSLLNLS